MKTVSVRDLRQRWPQTEALLQRESEIIITRDSRPVARLVRITEARAARPRFDPIAHAAWQRRMSDGKRSRWVDQALTRARADRRGPAGPR